MNITVNLETPQQVFTIQVEDWNFIRLKIQLIHSGICGMPKFDNSNVSLKLADVDDDNSFHLDRNTLTEHVVKSTLRKERNGLTVIDSIRVVKIGKKIFLYPYKAKHLVKQMEKKASVSSFFDKVLKTQMAFIIDLLIQDNGSRRLSAVFLKQNVGSNYKAVVDKLVYEGLVKVSDSYLANQYCKEYKLTPIGASFQYSRKSLTKMYDKMFKRIRKIQLSKNDDMHNNLNAHVALIEDGKIGLDRISYRHIYNSVSDVKKPIIKQFVKQIRSKTTWAKTDSDGGNRIYTVLQNMPKELRYVMKLDDQYCIEYDIKNAQQFFLADYMMQQHLRPNFNEVELNRFYDLTKSGQWNENLVYHFGYDKKTVKQMTMSYFFSKGYCHIDVVPNIDYNRQMDEFMMQFFPTLHKWICSNNKKNEVSIVCRRMESEWSHRVANGLRAKFNVSVVSCHDAIIVPELKDADLNNQMAEFIYNSTAATVKTENFKELLGNREIEIIREDKVRSSTINVSSGYEIKTIDELWSAKLLKYDESSVPFDPDVLEKFLKDYSKHLSKFNNQSLMTLSFALRA